jgi:cytochrome c-type biogenesis protein CcsB
MKKLFSFLFSMPLTGILLAIFFVAIAAATFIENDYQAVGAKAVVYNAKWFEFLLLLMTINMIGSIFKYKMYTKKKMALLVFHVSFIVIILGAGITRYYGYEGNIRIWEGKQEHIMQSADTYIQVKAKKGNDSVLAEKKVFLTPIKKAKFNTNISIDGKEFNVQLKHYFPKAGEVLEDMPNGEPYIDMMVSGKMGAKNTILKTGDQYNAGENIFYFGADADSNALKLTVEDSKPYITAPDTIYTLIMSANKTDTLVPGIPHSFDRMKLYTYKDMQFVLKDFHPSAGKKIVPATEDSKGSFMEAVVFEISSEKGTQEASVFGISGQQANWNDFNVDGVDFQLAFGSKEIALPFALFLRDFQLERYPGSENPMSYASEVTVIDEEMNKNFDFRIYMNHILNYRGYRFYQSSYDGRKEAWTLLSVNHDALGTIVTYIGYFLMSLGMILALFNRHNRFNALIKSIRVFREKRLALDKAGMIAVIFLLLAGNSFAQVDEEKISTALDSVVAKQEHAEKFTRLLTVDRSGRVEPLNTLALEVLRKLSYKNSMFGKSADQIFLGMVSNPNAWANVPLIRVGEENLQKKLGLDSKFATYFDFFTQHGEYLLGEEVQVAMTKKPASRSKYENYLIKVDERLNILGGVFNQQYLKIFPSTEENNDKWYLPSEGTLYFSEEEASFVQNGLKVYYRYLNNAIRTNDYVMADSLLNAFHNFQQEYGANVMPSERKVNLEIFYNNINIFWRLAFLYLIIGIILLVINIINTLFPKIKFNFLNFLLSSFAILIFLLHTGGLILRWYIAEHAPWSNGFEAMIFIAWSTVLAGIIFTFRKKNKTEVDLNLSLTLNALSRFFPSTSNFVLSATTLLAFIILMVANLNIMDPEITNLVPVLKSYWLQIHVSVITASYGFLGLAAKLAIINFILMLFKNTKNKLRVDYTIQELTAISELTLIVGLFLLSIGTFLGGVWANESWGRYWGWDPKETWALATMVAYIFILHMRFIPGMKSTFLFNAAGLFGFSTVIMTYFGVNYYLSGLHSYAQGDPVPIPKWVPVTVFAFLALSFIAYFNSKRVDKKSKDGAIIHSPENKK